MTNDELANLGNADLIQNMNGFYYLVKEDPENGIIAQPLAINAVFVPHSELLANWKFINAAKRVPPSDLE